MNEPILAQRDISWLSFNYRVLQEAADVKLPLYERIKFLAIYSSNLDEFFRVRVAHLRHLSLIEKKGLQQKIKENPENVLDEIQLEVARQLREYGKLLQNTLYRELGQQGIILYKNERVRAAHKNEVRHYFQSRVLSYLQPVILNAKKSREVFLINRALYFGLSLKRKQKGKKIFYAVLQIPTTHLPRIISLASLNKKYYYLWLDDVIRANLQQIFPGFEVLECISIKLNRDADLQITDEYSGNLAEKIKNHLNRRQMGHPSRFLYDAQASAHWLTFFQNHFKLEPAEMAPGGRYHNLNDLFLLPNPKFPKLAYPAQPALPHPAIDGSASFFELLEAKDVAIHFPYQKYDYVLRFFNEAAIDPKVREIKVTLYRIAANSFIANALISAVRNGKKVTVFVEIKARFDEENNLRWAEKMEAAGIHIIYSLPGLKVHAKVALVRRKVKGTNTWYGYFGTGNFNEKTAEIYADHGLLTTHEGMCRELKQVFTYLEKNKKPPSFQHLWVAQFNLVEELSNAIDREIAHQQDHRNGRMIIKVNNLEDPAMIKRLDQAAEEGVQVDLIVRGICCLKPRHKNIRVIRLVDRYLEHTRTYWFHNNGHPDVYLSSADWMGRNLYRRIEVAFPVIQPEIRETIEKELQLQLLDNVKAVQIVDDLKKASLPNKGKKKVRAQTEYYRWLKQRINKQGKTK